MDEELDERRRAVRSRARSSARRPALWCCIAFALAQMLCGAPFAWFGKDAGQRLFNAENATREILSMSMWCTVMHFQRGVRDADGDSVRR